MLQAEEHHRAPLLWLIAPYLAGLAAANAGVGGVGLWPAVVASAAAAGALVASWRPGAVRTTLWAGGVGMAAFLAGMARMHLALDEQPRWRTLPARELALEVEITRVFAPPREGERRSCLAQIVAAPDLVGDLAGQRLFFASTPPAADTLAPRGFVRSMRVRVHGVLVPLRRDVAERGGFAAYLLANGMRFQLDRAAVVEVTRAPDLLQRVWHALGERFETILRRGLPPDHPATRAHVAMFLGRTSELSAEQREGFLRSGTMHIFAISGLHVGVIAGCLAALMSVVRVPRRWGVVVGLVALWVFVEATGGTPSARRAFLMVLCLSAGRLLRRPANPLAALSAAALGVLLWDPLGMLSASFQFSYSVVAMLLLYGLPLRNAWLQLWQPWHLLPEDEWRWWQHGIVAGWRGTVTASSISLAATLVSTPLAIAAFGLASPGAILSNLVLVGVTGLAITAGFLSLVCGLVGLWPLSVLLNHAAALVLGFVDWGAQVAARTPGMFFRASFAEAWMAPAISVVVLTLAVAGYALGWRRWRGAFWVPPAALVLAIVLLVTPAAPGGQSAAMKSAYELAMERLRKSDPDSGPTLTAEQKAQLAEIDRVYQGKIAEREIFLKQRLAEAHAKGEPEEIEKILKQIAGERARLEEDREDEKNRVRRTASGKR